MGRALPVGHSSYGQKQVKGRKSTNQHQVANVPPGAVPGNSFSNTLIRLVAFGAYGCTARSWAFTMMWYVENLHIPSWGHRADFLREEFLPCRVTLSDEEAKRRKGPKTVMERMAPPTFDTAVEIIDRHTWRVHVDLAAAVDSALKGVSHAQQSHTPPTHSGPRGPRHLQSRGGLGRGKNCSWLPHKRDPGMDFPYGPTGSHLGPANVPIPLAPVSGGASCQLPLTTVPGSPQS